MPSTTVLVTRYGRRVFHKMDGCVYLKNAKNITAVPLDPDDRLRPCLHCYPDAPRARVFRRYCIRCSGSRPLPCEHNGGVKVTITYPCNRLSATSSPTDLVTRTAWVWPDRAVRYSA